MEERHNQCFKSCNKREIHEYDEGFNRFSYVWYILAFKLTVYATLYLVRLLMWNLKTDYVCILDNCENMTNNSVLCTTCQCDVQFWMILFLI